MKVRFKKLVTHAAIPKRANSTDAGYDLVCTDHAYDPEHDYIEYGTGLAVEIPSGYVGLLFPRSSVSKTPLILANCVGVIDSGFRGEVCLRYKRLDKDKKDYEYAVGDRIGQLVVLKHEQIEFEEVDELDDTPRGSGGFGSSGK